MQVHSACSEIISINVTASIEIRFEIKTKVLENIASQTALCGERKPESFQVNKLSLFLMKGQ